MINWAYISWFENMVVLPKCMGQHVQLGMPPAILMMQHVFNQE